MTDATETALVRGIIAKPADDTARLVYADWQDEHAGTVPCPSCDGGNLKHRECEGCGKAFVWKHHTSRCRNIHCEGESSRWADCPTCRGTGTVSDGRHERAELIRVQVELAHPVPMTWPHSDGPVCNCSRCQLRDRERELLTDDRREWTRVPCPTCEGGGVEVRSAPHFSDCATCKGTGDAMRRHGCAPHFRRGFVSRVEVPALSWVCERHGVSYGRSDSQQAWRVTPWALAVASTHPVTEFAFPFLDVVFVGEGRVAAESGDLPEPLYNRLRADKRARDGLAVFADEPELMNALATAAADWVRAEVLKAWGQEVRT